MIIKLIGTDIVQCGDCELWYEPQIGHDCPRRDDPYRPSNIKPASVFARIDHAVQAQVDEILARCESIRANSHIGSDGEYHVN